MKTILVSMATLTIVLLNTIITCSATLYRFTDESEIWQKDKTIFPTGFVNINHTFSPNITESLNGNFLDIMLNCEISEWSIQLETGKQFSGDTGFIQIFDSYRKIDNQWSWVASEDSWHFNQQITAGRSGFGPLYFGASYDDFGHDLLNDQALFATPPSTIYLQGHFGNNGSCRLYLEAVPVPEPTTMLLFGAGLVGLISARFRQKIS